jgi:hypothetical protein
VIAGLGDAIKKTVKGKRKKLMGESLEIDRAPQT